MHMWVMGALVFLRSEVLQISCLYAYALCTRGSRAMCFDVWGPGTFGNAFRGTSRHILRRDVVVADLAQ